MKKKQSLDSGNYLFYGACAVSKKNTGFKDCIDWRAYWFAICCLYSCSSSNLRLLPPGSRSTGPNANQNRKMRKVKISNLVSSGVLSACVLLAGCDAIDQARMLIEPSKAKAHGEHDAHAGHHSHKVFVTAAVLQDVSITQAYVCQIHSSRHIELRALQTGYLEEISVKEGQRVQKGDSLFRINPSLFEARLNADIAEEQLAQIELNNAERLFDQKVTSKQDVALAKAKLAKAQARVQLAQAELNFTDVRAPFDGIVDRQQQQQGSLVSEGDVLSTLSDNSKMWVYFNVPEARYLQYQANVNASKNEMDVELVLADHRKFPHRARSVLIEADFNNETGNIAFRSDFPNPDSLLRHGQTGNVLVHQNLPGAIVIPQRATFEVLAKRYVFVVEDDGLVRQQEVLIQNEQDDIFVIARGLTAGQKIVLEGVRQVRDGDKIEFEFRDPESVLGNLKNRAE